MISQSRIPTFTAAIDPEKVIVYEEQSEFNEWLDLNHDGIVAEGDTYFFSKSLSEIMYQLDYDAYISAKGTFEIEQQELEAEQREQFKQSVIDEFPTPVALHFLRAERSFETQRQRLDSLRDTWEALIFLVFALVLGECCHIQMSLSEARKPSNNRNLTMRDLYSDSLATKLDVVKAIFSEADLKKIDLQCRSLVSDDSLNTIRELNRVRNILAHGESVSEQESKRYFEENIEVVISVLESLEGLREVHMLRYKGQNESALEVRCEKFDGTRISYEIIPIQLKPEQLAISSVYLNDKCIIVKHRDLIYPLSPFFHFVVEEAGHETRLCYYKRKISGDKYTYAILGQSREVEFDRSEFEADFVKLRVLLQEVK